MKPQLYTTIGQLPRHQYVWVDTQFTHTKPIGFIPAVWFGLVSHPGRAWGCSVLLECGAIYRNLPPHAIAFDQEPARWTVGEAQTWDCYGIGFTTIEYEYLKGLDCAVIYPNGAMAGQYLFTAAHVGDGFSEYPEQNKEFLFVRLDNGRLTIQPTNHVVITDKSFTDPDKRPVGLKRQTEVYTAE